VEVGEVGGVVVWREGRDWEFFGVGGKFPACFPASSRLFLGMFPAVSRHQTFDFPRLGRFWRYFLLFAGVRTRGAGCEGLGWRVIFGFAEKINPLSPLISVKRWKKPKTEGTEGREPGAANRQKDENKKMGWNAEPSRPWRDGTTYPESEVVWLIRVLNMVVHCCWLGERRKRSRGFGPRWFLRGIRIRFSGGELRANAFSFGSAGIGPNGDEDGDFPGESQTGSSLRARFPVSATEERRRSARSPEPCGISSDFRNSRESRPGGRLRSLRRRFGKRWSRSNVRQ